MIKIKKILKIILILLPIIKIINFLINPIGGLYRFSMLKVTKRYQQAKNFGSVAKIRVVS
ncbi:hypothetical protein [Spiroplasma endosymbiont of Seladonia tumulorum]|uniref:hypothetical protein n=1 Tax=Spiroplasma endosymbiont of Seladonia tumulorum TaxID=3066321 RepID=UPI0030CD6DA8